MTYAIQTPDGETITFDGTGEAISWCKANISSMAGLSCQSISIILNGLLDTGAIWNYYSYYKIEAMAEGLEQIMIELEAYYGSPTSASVNDLTSELMDVIMRYSEESDVGMEVIKISIANTLRYVSFGND